MVALRRGSTISRSSTTAWGTSGGDRAPPAWWRSGSKKAMRPGDTVARLAGYVFLVVLFVDAVPDESEGRSSLGPTGSPTNLRVPPLWSRRVETFVTASIGLALAPNQWSRLVAQRLLRRCRLRPSYPSQGVGGGPRWSCMTKSKRTSWSIRRLRPWK